MKRENTDFIRMLKKYTTIDIEFIDTFFKKFKIGDDLNFDINENDVAKYLNISIKTLRDRLNNKYSSKKVYFEKADYIKKLDGKKAAVTYYLNYACFERLAMNGNTVESETVRLYFSKLREFITDNQHIFNQSLNKYDELKKYSNRESIYFFAVDETKVNYKIGSTKDIISRLRTYNTGKIDDVELQYFVLVKNRKKIEKCIKAKLE